MINANIIFLICMLYICNKICDYEDRLFIYSFDYRWWC
jgi:hypothetical protein